VGSVYVCEAETDQQASIGNHSRKKGQSNVRRKSMLKKISNIIKSRNVRFCSRNGGDVSDPHVKFFSQSQ